MSVASAVPYDLLTPREVAEVMRVSTMTVYRLIKSGELPAIRVGKHLRIRGNDVVEFLDARVVHVAGRDRGREGRTVARRLIGLDIGTNAVRVVELEPAASSRASRRSARSRCRPTRCARARSSTRAAVTAAIQRLWKELSLRKGEVRVGVASPRVLVRTRRPPGHVGGRTSPARCASRPRSSSRSRSRTRSSTSRCSSSSRSAEPGRRRHAARADAADPARRRPPGHGREPGRRGPGRRPHRRRRRPRPARAHPGDRAAGRGQRRRRRGDRQHRRRRHRRSSSTKPGCPGSSACSGSAAAPHRRDRPRPRDPVRPGRGAQAPDRPGARRGRRARPRRDGPPARGPRRADPRLARLLPRAAGRAAPAAGHAHRRRVAHSRARGAAARPRRPAGRARDAARAASRSATSGSRPTASRTSTRTCRPRPASRSAVSRPVGASTSSAAKVAPRRRARAHARRSPRSSARCCSSLLGGIWWIRKSALDTEKDRLAAGADRERAARGREGEPRARPSRRAGRDRGAAGPGRGACSRGHLVGADAPGDRAHDPERHLAHRVPGHVVTRRDRRSASTARRRRPPTTGRERRHDDHHDAAARPATTDRRRRDPTPPTARPPTGTATFTVVGLDFRSVSAWIQRIGTQIPSFATSGSRPRAGAATTADASGRDFVNFSSTADDHERGPLGPAREAPAGHAMKRDDADRGHRRGRRPHPALVLPAVLADVERPERHPDEVAEVESQKQELENTIRRLKELSRNAPQQQASLRDAAGRDPGDPGPRRVHPAGERHRVGGRHRLALDRADAAGREHRRRADEHDRGLDPGRGRLLPGARLPEPARGPRPARARRLDQRLASAASDGGRRPGARQHRQRHERRARPQRHAHRADVHRRRAAAATGRLHGHAVDAEHAGDDRPGGRLVDRPTTPPASSSGSSS